MLLTLDGIAVSLVGHTVTMTDPLSAKTFLGWVKKKNCYTTQWGHSLFEDLL